MTTGRSDAARSLRRNARELREVTNWFHAQPLSLSSTEAYANRVKALADRLDADADALDRRNAIRNANTGGAGSTVVGSADAARREGA